MRICNYYVWALLIMFLSVQPHAIAGISTQVRPIDLEDALVGVKLGTSVQALLARYPSLYQHKLVMGEVLYEACNQDKLEAFTFVEQPWSKGFVTEITTQYADVSVCRDETGHLPDLTMDPSAPRGVRLGDSESHILEQYGEPLRRKPGTSKAEVILEYRSSHKNSQVTVDNLTLFFWLKDGKVTNISLEGDMPGVKKPF